MAAQSSSLEDNRFAFVAANRALTLVGKGIATDRDFMVCAEYLDGVDAGLIVGNDGLYAKVEAEVAQHLAAYLMRPGSKVNRYCNVSPSLHRIRMRVAKEMERQHQRFEEPVVVVANIRRIA